MATLVARGVSPAEVFSAVAEEVERLLDAHATAIGRLEPDGTMAIVASSGTARDKLPVGSRLKLESTMASTAVVRTGGPTRVDSYSRASELVSRRVQQLGIRCTVAVPIMVGGSLWGSIAAGTNREQFPTDAEHRMADFTELVAAAIANADSRLALAASRRRIVAAADDARRRIQRDLRAKITADVSAQGGEFDVVMISNYETPMWSANGWLVNLQPYIDATPGYDAQDFLPQLRAVLSRNGDLYSVPFYGESSFLMYRKDLMARAGITMPLHPTWTQVEQIAAELHQPKRGPAGICLRGLPGWGENLAPIDTVINTFGGRWFNTAWQAQMTSPEVTRAVSSYVSMVQKYGEPGAPESGFSECLTLYSQGGAAMWYDATSAVSVIEDPASSEVAGRNGYAWAPSQDGRPSGWLYTWSLSIPSICPDKQVAWDFISWMTSKSYIRTVGEKLGWSHVPPGSRFSSYQIPQYKKLSATYGPLTQQSINATN